MNKKHQIIICAIFCLFAFSMPACHENGEKETQPENQTETEILGKYGEWESLPIRSKQEFEKGMHGGEGEQWMHSIVRSPSNPDIIYMSHDVNGSWISTDNGHTWRKNLDKGLYLSRGQSIMVDPVNPQKLFIIVDEREWTRGSASKYTGLYKSENSGLSWELVLQTETEHNRYNRNAIDFVPNVENGKTKSPKIWFAAFSKNGLYRSKNSGSKNSWEKLADIPVSVLATKVDPQNPQIIYVCTEKGLYRSTNGGENLEPWILEGEKITSIAVHPQSGKMYVAAQDNGLYVSENKTDFEKADVILNLDTAQYNVTEKIMRIIMNAGYPQQLFFVASNSQDIPATCVTNNGGKTWRHFETAITFPGMHRETSWARWIDKKAGTVVPNPIDSTDAIAHGRSTIFRLKIEEKSVQPVASSTGFTGNAANRPKSIAFHPFNENVFGIFCLDIGPRITTSNGNWFLEPYPKLGEWWYNDKLTEWACSFSGDFQPVPNSGVLVASIGWYGGNAHLMRSENYGKTWELITSKPGDTESQKHRYLFVGFDPNKPENVYAGYQMSTDAGKTFKPIQFPEKYYTSLREGKPNWEKPFVVGISNKDSKTYVFAIDREYRHILRSDDECKTWVEIADLADFQAKAAFMDDIVTIVPHPTNPDIVFTLDKNHDLLKVMYDEGTKKANAESLNVFDALPDTVPEDIVKDFNQIRTIAIDPKKPDIMYVNMLAPGIPNVYGSTDGGKTWKNISEGLPFSGPASMAVNPHTGELYRSSVIGTYKRKGLRE